MMVAAGTRRSGNRTVRGMCRAVLLLLALVALAGCADDPPQSDADAVSGKTPVVWPGDGQARSSERADVLAPDYRKRLSTALDSAPDAGGARVALPPEPGAGRLFTLAFATGTMQAVATPAAPARPGRSAATASAVVAASAGSTGFPAPGCRQLVLVVAVDFRARQATLRRFERDGPDAPWRETGEASRCLLGRNGLGVGRGLAPLPPGPVKREGDGRTPAGFFSLPQAFGYADAAMARADGVRLPYVPLTDRCACVTDFGSSLFGRVTGPDDRPSDGFVRQDRMVRDDRANVWGVVIGHNREQPAPGAGSCVFLNTRPPSAGPTGGSVGCPEAVAAMLAAWLDPAAQPVLAVLPERIYREGRRAWGLP